ncbi:MAG: radical SAM protein [Clostridia bacterium]|nr:radical SAM protein [Clostridia bacterium]
MDITLEKCNLCPHHCGINRVKGEVGICRTTDKIRVALANLHYFEEPCISGKNGSGTVFFSNCNLKCVFCQNHKISSEGFGEEITIDRLAEIFIELQEKGAHNINLVSPTIYSLQIKEAIKEARKCGLKVPMIYNSSGYDSKEAIQNLDGYIDVYLPDFKYYKNETAKKYSNIENYFEITSSAIIEMHRQVGNPIFDEEGMIEKGIMIRQMMLPSHVMETLKILDWIKNNLGEDAYISIMAQYFPTNKANLYSEINRKITTKELNIVKKYLQKINMQNGYIQKIGKHEEEFVPSFNLDGIIKKNNIF